MIEKSLYLTQIIKWIILLVTLSSEHLKLNKTHLKSFSRPTILTQVWGSSRFKRENPTTWQREKKIASYSNPSHISIMATKSKKKFKRNNFTIKYCNKEISKSYEGTVARDAMKVVESMVAKVKIRARMKVVVMIRGNNLWTRGCSTGGNDDRGGELNNRWRWYCNNVQTLGGRSNDVDMLVWVISSCYNKYEIFWYWKY